MNKALVISVVNLKGGVGKSVTSMNFAHALSIAGYKVLFVDTDHQGSSSEQLGVLGNSTESDNMTKQEIVDMDLFKLYTQEVDISTYIRKTKYTNIDIIPNARVAELIPFQTETFDEYFKGCDYEDKDVALYFNLESIKSKYDYIIIDGQPQDGRMTEVTLLASDHVITPIGADQFNLNTVADVYSKITMLNELYSEALSHKIEFKGFFINQAIPKSESQQMIKDYYFNSSLRDYFIDSPVRYSEAVASKSGIQGKMFIEYNKRANPSIDILNLLVNVLDYTEHDDDGNIVLDENGNPVKHMYIDAKHKRNLKMNGITIFSEEDKQKQIKTGKREKEK